MLTLGHAPEIWEPRGVGFKGCHDLVRRIFFKLLVESQKASSIKKMESWLNQVTYTNISTKVSLHAMRPMIYSLVPFVSLGKHENITYWPP
jgi:hypothetical protein